MLWLRCLLLAGVAAVSSTLQAQTAREGVLPIGADGKPLNLDFETGTLRDWTVDGDAFAGQPIEGDVVVKRRQDMASQHAGKFWIGGFERKRDLPQGTLTSVPFKVTHPWASLLVSGGHHDTTCVEVVRDDTGEVLLRALGRDRENLEPVAVDLTKHQGQSIFVRVVDKHTGHWGHVNFDDFRFHAAKPSFPTPPPAKPQLAAKPAAVPAHDTTRYAGLEPEQAALAMTVPKGFHVTLFAGEPDVQQPIAMAFDDRGRLWVAEAYSYPVRVPDEQARDRILIFEDTDGDGRFDTRKVFAEKLNLVSGMELGFGGVWVGAAPYLLFISDANGDDVPDGPPKILLDGWGMQDTHETLNSFIWGPDGWLYGCHGVFTHSLVGKPGTPDEQRTKLNAGIWRYHPTRHEFEVFAHGTSNPWGVDFNDRGQAFLTACVIPHLFHIIQGGRYHRQAGQHFDEWVYDDIKTIALHRHWVGNQWNPADRTSSDNSGGGHAHAGAMIYLGGAWPAEYRDQIFMNNIHGSRINMDRLTPKGSGYVGDRGPDFLLANDAWSQILYLTYGPDGQVYMIDWYDKNQCHHREDAGHDRTNGRIFKVSYGRAEPVKVDLKKLSNAELVQLQLHPNDWYVRHARRILQERGGDTETQAALTKILETHKDDTRRLRAMWALHVSGGLDESRLLKAMNDASPYVRGWAVQLACENGQPSAAVRESLAALAERETSPVARLYLASAVQQLELDSRQEVLDSLMQHESDTADHNLPLQYWYAMAPLAERHLKSALEMEFKLSVPLVRRYLIRRWAQLGTPEAIVCLVGVIASREAEWELLLHEANEGLKGVRQATMTKIWSELYGKLMASGNAAVRSEATALALTFGDPTAIAAQRAVLTDAKAATQARLDALAALVKIRAADLAPTLQGLISESALRGPAIRALAGYDDARTASLVLDAYASLNGNEKTDALNTLASRAPYAEAMLAAVGDKRIASTDLTADVIRQLRNLKNKSIDEQIGKVWGTVRDTPEEKAKLIVETKALLSRKPAAANVPDLPLGRAVFAKTCQQCHTLFGVGNKIGPELTGSNRANLDYVLANVLDPSALIGKDYLAHVVLTSDGRTLTGLVRGEDQQSVTIVTATETITLPKGEIEQQSPSTKSMMPDDILKPLSEKEVRSLVAYLASPTQTLMQATPDNAKNLFNGRDLAGWQGDASLWSVENGELIGRTPGLKKNEFLRSDLLVGDFRLRFQVKLAKNEGNSGVQFRSEALPSGDVRGYQADIGAGWWGKLYEEHGRALLWKDSGERHVKPGEWNGYEIEAVGNRIRTRINGQPCVDLDDPAGAARGIFAIQLHSGGPTEVHYRGFELELNPKEK